MPRLQALEVRTTRGGSGRVQAEADFPPGGAGRRTRAGRRRRVRYLAITLKVIRPISSAPREAVTITFQVPPIES